MTKQKSRIHSRDFGNGGYSHLYKGSRKLKLGSMSEMIVDLAPRTSLYHIYMPDLGEVVRIKHSHFDESKFPSSINGKAYDLGLVTESKEDEREPETLSQ